MEEGGEEEAKIVEIQIPEYDNFYLDFVAQLSDFYHTHYKNSLIYKKEYGLDKKNPPTYNDTKNIILGMFTSLGNEIFGDIISMVGVHDTIISLVKTKPDWLVQTAPESIRHESLAVYINRVEPQRSRPRGAKKDFKKKEVETQSEKTTVATTEVEKKSVDNTSK